MMCRTRQSLKVAPARSRLGDGIDDDFDHFPNALLRSSGALASPDRAEAPLERCAMKNIADSTQSLVDTRALAACFVAIFYFRLMPGLFSIEVNTGEVL